MGDFVAAFLPGYSLATNSGTDGFIRSAILSRFPVTRSTKWLDGVSLTSFGYNGTFTRDLFEAQIAVPGFPQPLHVFTTHLKSGQDSDNAARRGAEARAISNFFTTIFLATNALRPYLLTGDMNEDLARPSPGSAQPIQSLANPATGLTLTLPVNPQTGSELTFPFSAVNLSRRYDYVLPCGLLATNVANSEVFRSDLAANIAPALPGDSKAASDHLPVRLVFSNPFTTPFRVVALTWSNGIVRLLWNAVPGGQYRVEATDALTNWAVVAANLQAAGSEMSFSTNAGLHAQYYRVRTEP
jgi:endonuclease/exonuclease/phosphatase family metal-dependent hydrolase